SHREPSSTPGSSTWRPWSTLQFLALLARAPAGFLEYAFEHFGHGRFGLTECPNCLAFLDRAADHIHKFRLALDMARLVPFADGDQMLFQPRDGITQRPPRGFVGRAITGGIVAGGMAGDAG